MTGRRREWLQTAVRETAHGTSAVLHDPREVPAWLRETAGEQRFPVLIALLAAIVFQASLPTRFLLVPWWALVIPEALLLLVNVVGNPLRLTRESTLLRRTSLTLVAVITFGNTASAVLLIHDLLTVNGRHVNNNAATLLVSGGSIYVVNIVAFALWYWEFDRGGPLARMHGTKAYPDFLFAQMGTPEMSDPSWEPLFFDYFYVSFTNATAFSPTDTLPMSRWAKALMLLQSAIALVTIGMVIARAVNVLQ